jgi:hypothetical protein
LGLTREDPTLALPFGLDPADTLVRGALTGEVDYSGNTRAGMVIESARAFGFGVAKGIVDPQTAGFDFYLKWWGPGPVQSTVHALQYEVVNPGSFTLFNPPTRFLAYGSFSPLTVDVGGAAGMTVPLDKTKVSGTGELSGSFTLPGGYQLAQKQYWARFAQGSSMKLVFDDTPATAFSYRTPRLALPSAPSMTLFAYATEGERGSYAFEAGLPADAQRTITLSAAPALSAPADGASINAQTLFSWSAFSGGVHWLTVRASDGPSGPTQHVITVASSASLPDLSQLGIVPPIGARYVWHVQGMAPLADLDAATAGDGLADPWLRNGVGQPPEASGRLGASELRRVTVGP